jgi:DNA-binding XRE family transcriptional regulator
MAAIRYNPKGPAIHRLAMKKFTPGEFIEAGKKGLVDYDPVAAITDPDAQHALAARLGRREAAHAIAVDLAELRVALGMSQTALAEAIGKRQPHISRIEHDPSSIQLSTLTAYLKGLGIEHASIVVERDGAIYDLQLM